MHHNDALWGPDDPILITGAGGFIGCRLVQRLLDRGFRKLRCFSRPSTGGPLAALAQRYDSAIEVITGNLLSRDDCARAAHGVVGVLHLAAARGEKSFPDAYMNSVVTTRNLLDAAARHGRLNRFVNVSSFAVYSNIGKRQRQLLDETSPIELQPHLRGEAYCYAKVRQEELVAEHATGLNIPYVIVRPGYVYGPGNEAISSRVGIGTFGVFLHLGGGNRIPLTYVDNCIEAIVLAGLTPGVDGQIFNVVDDDLPSSRAFLRAYKRQVHRFRSIYLPHAVSYALCYAWEKYSDWTAGQLPPAYNRRTWHAYWKATNYSNDKLKRMLGWRPVVSTQEGLRRYFAACAARGRHA